MKARIDTPHAAAFVAVNSRRRAIRKFDGRAVPDAVLRELVAQAQLAPSSRNSQPYRFLCVRSTGMKASVARLCNDQQAAHTAGALVVVIAGRSLAFDTLEAWCTHLKSDHGLTADSATYHEKQAIGSRRFLEIGNWAIWSPLAAAIAAVSPVSGLLPLGATGIRNWAGRNAIYAAQTFMLAAAAYGLDTCPMEGFKAAKLAKLLKLPRNMAIPIVIAVGHAASDARCEPQWRKPSNAAMALL